MQIINVVTLHKGVVSKIDSFVLPTVELATEAVKDLSPQQLAVVNSVTERQVYAQTIKKAEEHFKSQIMELYPHTPHKDYLEEFVEDGYWEFGADAVSLTWSNVVE